MLKKLIYLSFVFNSFFLNAQNIDWTYGFGEANWIDSKSVLIDNQDNIYVLGRFSDSIDIDPSSSNIYLYNEFGGSYLQKLNAKGELLWAKNIYTTHSVFGNVMQFDEDSSIIISGIVTVFEGKYGFCSKLDKEGNLIWFKPILYIQNYGINLDSYIITDVSVGNNNSIYCLGTFINDLTDYSVSNPIFDISKDFFIQKFDLNGNILWTKIIGGKSDDIANAMTIDSDNNLYITGSFRGTVDFDTSNDTLNKVSNGSSDVFILKLNETGNLIWVESFGSNSHDFATDITIKQNNNLIIAGAFSDTLSFNNEIEFSNGLHDAFILELDTQKNYIWSKKIGGTKNDYIENVLVNEQNNIYNETVS